MSASMKNIILFLSVAALMSGCSNPVSSSNSQEPNKPSSSLDSSSVSSLEPSSSVISSSSSPISYSSVNSNPNNCDNHQLSETVVKEASLLEKGTMHYHCANCGADFDADYFKMDECVFEDMTFMYDGNDHQVLIDGLLPYGVSVAYENNSRKTLGSQEATAKFINDKNEVFLEKKANINIIENIGLPNVRIVTTDGDDPDWHSVNGERPYEDMTVSIDNCDSKYVKNNVAGEIKVRGNSTNQESVAKRAFRLKLSSKTNLLGLNSNHLGKPIEEKSWVLLADFFDQSRFRNASAFVMGDALFNYSGYYSSDYKHVTLYMNGENRGVYLLAEQQQAKNGRIPINEAKSSETSNNIGYLVEIDGLVSQQGHVDSQTGLGVLEGDPCFIVEGSPSVNGVSIKSKGYAIKTDTNNDEQKQFIRKYMNNASKAMANTCNGNLQIVDENGDIQNSPYDNAFDTLNAFIDLDSFFRMYVLQEFMKDYDAGWGSFYMYIDFSSKSTARRLTMAAPWDFDLGEGNKQSGGMGGFPWGQGGSSSSDKDLATSGISSPSDNFLSSTTYTNDFIGTMFNPWLYMLSQTSFFNNLFKKYYSVFNKSGVFERMVNSVKYERVAFKDSFDANHATYGKGASGATLMQTRQYDTFDDAVDYLLNWFNARKTYLDQTWGQ